VDERKLELRLGIFVTVGLTVFCAVMIYFLKEGAFLNTYEVTAYFEDVTGVDAKSPVQMGGVKIGKVKTIDPPLVKDVEALRGQPPAGKRPDSEFLSAEAKGDFTHLTDMQKKSRIKVVLQIEPSYRIRSRTVRIASKGLIGDKFLEFRLSEADFSKDLPTDGYALVEGETPTSQEELLKGVQKTLEFFGDPALKERVNNFLDEATSLFKKGQPVLDDTDKLLHNVDTTVTTLGEDAHTMLGTVTDQVTRTSDSLNGFLIGFDPTREKLNSSLGEMEKTLASLRGMVDDIKGGKGSIGRLYKDEALYERLVGVADSAQLTLEDADTAILFLTDNPASLIWGRDEKKEPIERLESRPRSAYALPNQ